MERRALTVLQLVARGLSHAEIAAQLAIGEAARRTHVSSILAKFHLAIRTRAALRALRQGSASLDEGGATE